MSSYKLEIFYRKGDYWEVKERKERV